MTWWYNNEDAGDLHAFMDADYEAEMNMEREARRRDRFVEEWDREMSFPTCVYLPDPSGGAYATTRIEVYGPRDLPWCEECCARIRRDNHEASYHGGDGVFFCSDDCREEYDCRPVYHEGREFPSYD